MHITASEAQFEAKPEEILKALTVLRCVREPALIEQLLQAELERLSVQDTTALIDQITQQRVRILQLEKLLGPEYGVAS